MKNKKSKLKVNAIQHLLDLIEMANENIESSKKMNSPLMMQQYEHLKKEHTKELLELLAEYRLPIQLAA